VQLPAREVEVRALSLIACTLDPPAVSVRVEAAKGYYVRSLGRDLAEALHTVGHLKVLRRTRSGCFGIEDATPLDVPREKLASRIEPLEKVAARALPVARLTEAGAVDARHGRAVKPGDVIAPSPGTGAWFDPDGVLVAIGEIDDSGTGRVRRGFAPGV
jgi:tRNA pseudouridine55 synthase